MNCHVSEYKINNDTKETMPITKIIPKEKGAPLTPTVEKIEYKVKKHVKVRGIRAKSVAFHPTQPLLIIGFYTGGIHMYDYDQKKVIAVYTMPTVVRSVCFHPTESKFAAGCDDYKVCIYDYATDKQMILRGHEDYVRCVCFHPTQPLLASCGDDMTVRIWDTENGKCIAILTTKDEKKHYVMSVSFAPRSMFGEDDIIIACNLRSGISIWKLDKLEESPELTLVDRLKNMMTGKPCVFAPDITFSNHKEDANNCACHPTQKLIATCSDDNTICLRTHHADNVEKKDFFSSLQQEKDAQYIICHTAPVCSIAFITDTNLFVSASEDGTVVGYDFVHHDLQFRISFDFEDISQINEIYRNTPISSRCWNVASHPTQPMFAVGHDHGFAIYTVDKKEPSS
jgi:coatomer protein complex subunit alpha (xenin)